VSNLMMDEWFRSQWSFFSPYRCGVKFNISFRCFRSNVESHSTAYFAVSGPMSSHTRQRFPLFQVLFRVTFDSAVCCSRSNVESHSTALCAISGPMLSHTRQRFAPFQVQCRVTFDGALRHFRSNVESHSTALFAVPDPISSTYRLFLLYL
jgi:hypothetical protein